jgi:hypothetical protein
MSTTEELLGRKCNGSGIEIREYGRRGSVKLTTWQLISAKVDTNIADERRSLADSGHGVLDS